MTNLTNASDQKIVYYCKNCKKIVPASQVGRKYEYRCPECHKTNVSFGTKKSIVNFYHIEPEEKAENEIEDKK